MPTVRMRVLPAMPGPVRTRLAYRTRMLMANDDVFDIAPADAMELSKRKWATSAPTEAPAAPRRRSRRTARTAAPSASEPEEEAKDEA
jgi:hypothetical protein